MEAKADVNIVLSQALKHLEDPDAAPTPQEEVQQTGDTVLYLNLDEPTVVNLLLQAKADPNRRSAQGLSPLFSACYVGNVEVVELLLEAKANPNFRHPENQLWTCTAIALSTKRQDMLRILADAGAHLEVCLIVPWRLGMSPQNVLTSLPNTVCMF